LGTATVDKNGAIVVTLHVSADGTTAADAIRIIRQTPALPHLLTADLTSNPLNNLAYEGLLTNQEEGAGRLLNNHHVFVTFDENDSRPEFLATSSIRWIPQNGTLTIPLHVSEPSQMFVTSDQPDFEVFVEEGLRTSD
jgi:hypothetical protein